MYKADVNGKVTKIDPSSDEVTVLKKRFGGLRVEWVIPSPNNKKFVVVRKISQTKREILITDVNGKKQFH